MGRVEAATVMGRVTAGAVLVSARRLAASQYRASQGPVSFGGGGGARVRVSASTRMPLGSAKWRLRPRR